MTMGEWVGKGSELIRNIIQHGDMRGKEMKVRGGLGLAMPGEHDAAKQLGILNKRVMEGSAL